MKNFIVRSAALFSMAVLCASCATQPGAPMSFYGATPRQWSARLASSEMVRRGDSLDWQPGGKAKWDYTAGLFTLALLKLNPQDPRTLAFAENAIGSFLSTNGAIQTYRPEEYQLDALNPGKTVLALGRLTRDPRYPQAAALLRRQLDTQPRTQGGGFWHKQRYTQQMWLDGLYMGAPFYAEQARMTGEPAAVFEDIALQFRLIDAHTYDARSGLLYHGWDAARVQPWANPVTGCSSNFWGRAIGWYAMGLVDTLDYIPTNSPARPELIALFQKVCAGMLKYQDAVSGTWYQVVDQGARAGNYREATVSCMMVYALAKGVNQGYLPRDYRAAIEKGYHGILEQFIRYDGNLQWSLMKCCSVAGLGGSPSNGKMRDGSFEYYIHEPVVKNDLKGVGPFILAGIELETLLTTP